MIFISSLLVLSLCRHCFRRRNYTQKGKKLCPLLTENRCADTRVAFIEQHLEHHCPRNCPGCCSLHTFPVADCCAVLTCLSSTNQPRPPMVSITGVSFYSDVMPFRQRLVCRNCLQIFMPGFLKHIGVNPMWLHLSAVTYQRFAQSTLPLSVPPSPTHTYSRTYNHT